LNHQSRGSPRAVGSTGSPGEAPTDRDSPRTLTRFLSELGTGFAFVGRQYKITVGTRDYFVDLLFYHLELRRFIVFELKAVAAEPEHIGKLNFYVNVVDDRLRKEQHGDGPTVGILLAAGRDDVAVQYLLAGIDHPAGGIDLSGVAGRGSPSPS